MFITHETDLIKSQLLHYLINHHTTERKLVRKWKLDNFHLEKIFIKFQNKQVEFFECHGFIDIRCFFAAMTIIAFRSKDFHQQNCYCPDILKFISCLQFFFCFLIFNFLLFIFVKQPPPFFLNSFFQFFHFPLIINVKLIFLTAFSITNFSLMVNKKKKKTLPNKPRQPIRNNVVR